MVPRRSSLLLLCLCLLCLPCNLRAERFNWHSVPTIGVYYDATLVQDLERACRLPVSVRLPPVLTQAPTPTPPSPTPPPATDPEVVINTISLSGEAMIVDASGSKNVSKLEFLYEPPPAYESVLMGGMKAVLVPDPNATFQAIVVIGWDTSGEKHATAIKTLALTPEPPPTPGPTPPNPTPTPVASSVNLVTVDDWTQRGSIKGLKDLLTDDAFWAGIKGLKNAYHLDASNAVGKQFLGLVGAPKPPALFVVNNDTNTIVKQVSLVDASGNLMSEADIKSLAEGLVKK